MDDSCRMSVARVSKALVRLSIPDGQAFMESGLDWGQESGEL